MNRRLALMLVCVAGCHSSSPRQGTSQLVAPAGPPVTTGVELPETELRWNCSPGDVFSIALTSDRREIVVNSDPELSSSQRLEATATLEILATGASGGFACVLHVHSLAIHGPETGESIYDSGRDLQWKPLSLRGKLEFSGRLELEATLRGPGRDLSSAFAGLFPPLPSHIPGPAEAVRASAPGATVDWTCDGPRKGLPAGEVLLDGTFDDGDLGSPMVDRHDDDPDRDEALLRLMEARDNTYNSRTHSAYTLRFDPGEGNAVECVCEVETEIGWHGKAHWRIEEHHYLDVIRQGQDDSPGEKQRREK